MHVLRISSHYVSLKGFLPVLLMTVYSDQLLMNVPWVEPSSILKSYAQILYFSNCSLQTAVFLCLHSSKKVLNII